MLIGMLATCDDLPMLDLFGRLCLLCSILPWLLLLLRLPCIHCCCLRLRRILCLRHVRCCLFDSFGHLLLLFLFALFLGWLLVVRWLAKKIILILQGYDGGPFEAKGGLFEQLMSLGPHNIRFFLRQACIFLRGRLLSRSRCSVATR